MIGPAIAIEKQLAPNVVNPPCASKIAWKINTMIPKILVTHGPNKIAPRPVPVSYTHLDVYKRQSLFQVLKDSSYRQQDVYHPSIKSLL